VNTETEAAVEWITCACCGKLIPDTAEENVDHDVHPSPHDIGFGSCVECFGDRRVTADDEASIRKRLGWAGQAFYDARIKTLPTQLSPANAANFATMSFAKKVRIIAGLVERGVII